VFKSFNKLFFPNDAFTTKMLTVIDSLGSDARASSIEEVISEGTQRKSKFAKIMHRLPRMVDRGFIEVTTIVPARAGKGVVKVYALTPAGRTRMNTPQ
jgi:hypothetical protein